MSRAVVSLNDPLFLNNVILLLRPFMFSATSVKESVHLNDYYSFVSYGLIELYLLSVIGNDLKIYQDKWKTVGELDLFIIYVSGAKPKIIFQPVGLAPPEYLNSFNVTTLQPGSIKGRGILDDNLCVTMCQFLVLANCLYTVKLLQFNMYKLKDEFMSMLLSEGLKPALGGLYDLLEEYNVKLGLTPGFHANFEFEEELLTLSSAITLYSESVKRLLVINNRLFKTYHSFLLVRLCKEMSEQAGIDTSLKRRLDKIVTCVQKIVSETTSSTLLSNLDTINKFMLNCFVVLDVFGNQNLLSLVNGVPEKPVNLLEWQRKLEGLSKTLIDTLNSSGYNPKQCTRLFTDINETALQLRQLKQSGVLQSSMGLEEVSKTISLLDTVSDSRTFGNLEAYFLMLQKSFWGAYSYGKQKQLDSSFVQRVSGSLQSLRESVTTSMSSLSSMVPWRALGIGLLGVGVAYGTVSNIGDVYGAGAGAGGVPTGLVNFRPQFSVGGSGEPHVVAGTAGAPPLPHIPLAGTGALPGSSFISPSAAPAPSAPLFVSPAPSAPPFVAPAPSARSAPLGPPPQNGIFLQLPSDLFEHSTYDPHEIIQNIFKAPAQRELGNLWGNLRNIKQADKENIQKILNFAVHIAQTRGVNWGILPLNRYVDAVLDKTDSNNFKFKDAGMSASKFIAEYKELELIMDQERVQKRVCIPDRNAELAPRQRHG